MPVKEAVIVLYNVYLVSVKLYH